jgi:hypothetical protein
MAPTVAYAVRQGDRNEELRYSLRSLANLDHHRVIIAGHCPPWVTNVEHIPTVQTGSKYERAARNWRAVCEALDEPFLMFNDDFFVMRPTTVETWHRGPLVDVIGYYEARGQSRYLNGMRRTAELLDRLGYPDPLSYGLHVPMLIDPAWWLKMLTVTADEPGPLHLRTVYGNLAGIGGTYMADVKAHLTARTSQLRHSPFLSTDDDSFQRFTISEKIRATFPESCRYET